MDGQPALPFDLDLIRKYDTRAPRYTSYPTAPQWTPAFGAAQQRDHLARLPAGPREISLYVHLPFCLERCTFCGCNVVISKRTSIAGEYLDWVEREADVLLGALPRGCDLQIRQLHWGGGTPNYLSPTEMERLHGMLARRFEILPGAEQALELDPRRMTEEQVGTLARLGFNRASIGIQDTTAAVQQAVNRVQPNDVVQRAIDWLRRYGFGGVNIDLIYGLPLQTPASWAQTLADMALFQPDRVAMYGFAFLPAKMRQQVRIDPATLPPAETRFELLAAGVEWFLHHGYCHIGMDHFAREDDELAVAWRDHSLQRNFMGYTTLAGRDLFGLGTSSISCVDHAFAQNEKRLAEYKRTVLAGELPVERGLALDADDRLRARVIQDLMCFHSLDIPALESTFQIAFARYFAPELERLRALEADGLVACAPDRLRVLPRGQYLLRNVAAVFDAYLHGGRKSAPEVEYSRTV